MSTVVLTTMVEVTVEAESFFDALPDLPVGLATPSIYYEYDDGRVETTFGFNKGSVRYWISHDETQNDLPYYESQGKEPLNAITGLGSEELNGEAIDALTEWMSAIHQRIDSYAYNVVLQTNTSAIQEAIITAALMELPESDDERDHRETMPGGIGAVDAGKFTEEK